jgi:hypothetical protein
MRWYCSIGPRLSVDFRRTSSPLWQFAICNETRVKPARGHRPIAWGGCLEKTERIGDKVPFVPSFALCRNRRWGAASRADAIKSKEERSLPLTFRSSPISPQSRRQGEPSYLLTFSLIIGEAEEARGWNLSFYPRRSSWWLRGVNPLPQDYAI